jgi:hypothetical protein
VLKTTFAAGAIVQPELTLLAQFISQAELAKYLHGANVGEIHFWPSEASCQSNLRISSVGYVALPCGGLVPFQDNTFDAKMRQGRGECQPDGTATCDQDCALRKHFI